MFPYKNSITIDRKNNRPIYLQLCDQIISFIRAGKLPPSTKLPGSRRLADILGIHRKTMVAAFDELIAQGWIVSIPSKGTFINSELPIISPVNLNSSFDAKSKKQLSGFDFFHNTYIDDTDLSLENDFYLIGDGVPDNRLAPIDEIAKTYRNISKKEYHKKLLGYSSIYGNKELRKTLVTYLNQSRGLDITIDNILITRGSQMGLYLSSQLLLQQGKTIVVGATNYSTADNTFEYSNGKIERIKVDQNGLNTQQLEMICKKKQVDAVYVTSHHHHPTTVTLSAERRMHLLLLAEKYCFAIIEDDYDYDFHYENSPILPLASNDYHGNVIYIGAFSKIIAPAMRIGYLVAPKDFILEAAKLRRIIDRQGDTLLEETLATMIKVGDVQRHCNKVIKIYKQRRDLFCKLLKDKLSDYLSFDIPNGGMAIWITLDKKYNWEPISVEAKKRKLYISDWKRYDMINSGHNSIRLGFASFNEIEIPIIIDRLHEAILAATTL